MVCVRLEFPLGVYHALSEQGDRAEWAPSPVRLIGALLAATAELPSDDPDADRAVLQRICDAPPPTIYAPRAVPAAAQMVESDARPKTVAELRGASRWAPRNPSPSELKKDFPGAKTTNVAEVNKAGVAVGEIPVLMAWPQVNLDDSERERLRRLLGEVAWLGTSRSPALCQLIDDPGEERVPNQVMRWSPLQWRELLADAKVRVPGPDLIRGFDQAFAARRATRDRVEAAGHIPRPRVDLWPYEVSDPTAAAETFDPRHWGRLAIVELDSASEMTPRADGAYLVARALRAALMSAFADRGESGEAPTLLHGHGARPHLAILPLPFAGRRHGDGRVLGFGLLYPHPSRAPEVAAEFRPVESALGGFFPGAGSGRMKVDVPSAGSFLLRPVDPSPTQTLSKHRYIGPARRWATVTPVVHSRWRKGDEEAALVAQVSADCAHVGLPVPTKIERLRSSALRGGGNRIVPGPGQIRAEWRHSIQGPRSHLVLEFDREVVGPIVVGKARHFGLGLCLPFERTASEEQSDA